MAKKKNSMALFEVISKTRDKNPDSEVLVPNWVKPGRQDQRAPETDAKAPDILEPIAPEPGIETPAPQDEMAVSKAPTPSAPVLPTTSTWEPRALSDAPKTSDLPIWSTDGGRLTLSLNYVSCLVVSTGVLLLIAGAFWLGRTTAPSPVTPGRTGQPVVKRQVGKYYMVIQTLDGFTTATMAEAKQIVKFCSANGEPSEVKQVDKNLIVWSATPFDSRTSEEAIAHALFVQNELGVKYARKYGSKYKFRQPQKNGKLVPVLYPYTRPKP